MKELTANLGYVRKILFPKQYQSLKELVFKRQLGHLRSVRRRVHPSLPRHSIFPSAKWDKQKTVEREERAPCFNSCLQELHGAPTGEAHC